MAIKRVAPQQVEQVQTTSKMVYRLSGSGSGATKSKTSGKVKAEPLATSNTWLRQDLLRSIVTLIVILVIIAAIKYSGVLNNF